MANSLVICIQSYGRPRHRFRSPLGRRSAAIYPEYRWRAASTEIAAAPVPSDRRLAEKVASATEGHPLAIALLAGAWDENQFRSDEFLQNWAEELAAAERSGLAGHQRTFSASFARSYDQLPDNLPKRLRALSVFPFCNWAGLSIIKSNEKLRYYIFDL